MGRWMIWVSEKNDRLIGEMNGRDLVLLKNADEKLEGTEEE